MPTTNDPPNDDSLDRWVQVDAASHYNPATYLSVARLASIGHQLHLLHEHFRDGHVMEVGVGAGLAATLLKQCGHEVTTLDVDQALRPDIHGSVTEIPRDDGAFDCFSCCQVLEHIAWDDARTGLKELARVSRLGGVVSVPTVRKALWLRFFHFRKRARTIRLPLSISSNAPMHWAKEHQWELGAGVSIRQFRNACVQAGLTVTRDFQVAENPYHHFFVLRKG